MNANEIKKIAKEVREGRSNRTYDEMVEILNQSVECMATDAGKWADKTVTQISNAIEEIRQEVERLAPKKEHHLVPMPGSERLAELKEEYSKEEVKKKNFKTVLKMMQEEGQADAVLAAIRWFAIKYGKENYASVKTVKGMLERRGYELTSGDGSIIVILNGNEVADIESQDGTVEAFNIR